MISFPASTAKAACYAHSIITTHPYRDGNKRAGMETAFAFLARNRVIVEVDWREYVAAALRVAIHEWDIPELKGWLVNHARPYEDWFDAHLRDIQKNGKFRQKRYPRRR